MTHTTEQDRAEFEREFAENYDLDRAELRQGQYAVPVTQAAWYGWQAARRAPAVPVPQAPCVICGSDEPYTGTCGSNDPRALCKKPATQPPEAAPVELPEAAAIVLSKLGTTCMFPSAEISKGAKLYTEQQVLQLLAAHGITQDKPK